MGDGYVLGSDVLDCCIVLCCNISFCDKLNVEDSSGVDIKISNCLGITQVLLLSDAHL